MPAARHTAAGLPEARCSLAELIETLPANKIMAFSGDYLFVEGVYGHAEMARENAAWVLAEKVLSGYLTDPEALELVRKILCQNALDLYRLQVP